MTTYTKDSLINALREIDLKVENDFGVEVTELNCDEFTDMQDAARNAFLYTVFEKKTFSLFASDFTIYCDSWADRCTVVKQVAEIGFKNIQTYVPKVCDGNGGSKDDPEAAFAVNVNQSEALIFGRHTETFMAFFKDFVEVVREKVIYTYAHDADYRLTFSCMKTATLLTQKLNDYFGSMAQQAAKLNKATPAIKISMQATNLDAWTVDISMDA